MGLFDLDHQSEAARLDQGPEPAWRFRARGIPPLFLICRESKLVAEKIYAKTFGSMYAPPTILFNLEDDILFLNWGYYLEVDRPQTPTVLCSYFPDEISEDVKKVKNLALYNGNSVAISMENWLDLVLRRFGNVRNLTMVAPKFKSGDDLADLVFLEGSCLLDLPIYSHWAGEANYHPDFEKEFPNLSDEGNLFWTSECLWKSSPYSEALSINEEMNGGKLPTWSEIELSCKPIVTRQRYLELVQRRVEYDRERDAERVE